MRQSIKTLLLNDIKLPNLSNWHQTKRRWSRYLPSFPKNSEILSAYKSLLSDKKIQPNLQLEKTLKVRSIRTLSGVAPFAVMMKPNPCPGNCIYCVSEPGMPKSYMSDEPAAARAKQYLFDPQAQIISRISQMEKTGHSPEKLQIIVIGGTFSAYPDNYKKQFLKAIFDTCNNAEVLLTNLSNQKRPSFKTKLSKNLISTKLNIPKTIQESQLINQSAKYRIIGMSIETRPDWITEAEVKLLRKYGVTKVQMGVQALDEKILKKINRGHSLEAVVKATKTLRNTGFKINYHFMPNLPGSNPDKDIQMAKLMFSDPRFKPDTLKIYPCIVLPNTELEKLYQQGKYQSYSDDTLADTLIKIKQQVPPYCRIDRLVRDITKNWTVSGTKKTNMRQLVHQQMRKQNIICQCIRCREVRNRVSSNDQPKLNIMEYKASDGKELFITYEHENKLYAMLRLRFPDKKSQHNPLFPVLKNSALIRELHVFGLQAKISNSKSNFKKTAQHHSLGKKLITKAEEISRKNSFRKIAIISGVGVRNYYQKLGYQLKNSYMIKEL